MNGYPVGITPRLFSIPLHIRQLLSGYVWRTCFVLVSSAACTKPEESKNLPAHRSIAQLRPLPGEYRMERGRLEINCDMTFSKGWGDDQHAWHEMGHLQGNKFKILQTTALQVGRGQGNLTRRDTLVAREVDASDYLNGYELQERKSCKQ